MQWRTDIEPEDGGSMGAVRAFLFTVFTGLLFICVPT